MGCTGRRALTFAGIAAVAVSVGAPTALGSVRCAAGGTYRVGVEAVVSHSSFGPYSSFGWTSGFDPSAEHSWFGVYSSLLVRTLVGTDHVAGAAGARIVPDLAERIPTPTAGGRRYRFTLRRGVRFGPPLDRPITSSDIRYAFDRLRDVRISASYAFYFDVIRAIRTPDARTIVFELRHPSADFLRRLTLPAAGPIPREVAGCFEGTPGGYGANLVSSGPYMIEGSDRVHLRSCNTLARARGISDTQLMLVRNPDYDPGTDSLAARESLPDRFVFTAMGAAELGRRIAAGELEQASFALLPSRRVTDLAARARGRRAVRIDPVDGISYLSMNVTQPPFDDVHVRRAMNWALDRAALRDATGGELAGPIARHILPDRLLGGVLAGFNPYATPGDHGDVRRARAELARSRYASVGGVCVARACRHVTLTLDDRNGERRMLATIEAGAARIGIVLRPAVPANPYPYPSENAAISALLWKNDYADPAAMIEPPFTRAGIPRLGDASHANLSLLGITRYEALALGVRGRLDHVPTIAPAAAHCRTLLDRRRLRCYAALDRALTTRIVPWVPLLWPQAFTLLGPQATCWTWDRNAGATGFAHVAVRR